MEAEIVVAQAVAVEEAEAEVAVVTEEVLQAADVEEALVIVPEEDEDKIKNPDD